MILKVRSDLRFQIYGPNYAKLLCLFGCFGLLLDFDRMKKEDEEFPSLELWVENATNDPNIPIFG